MINKYFEEEVVYIPWGGNPIVQYYNGRFITGDNRIATSFDKTKLNNKYLYYWLLNKIDLISSLYRGSGIKHPDMVKVLEIDIPIPSLETQEKINARGSTLKTITKDEFKEFLIPIPPLETQEKIVEILDKFEALINDSKQGLKKEIELRQKQYEYYRAKLLDFQKEE